MVATAQLLLRFMLDMKKQLTSECNTNQPLCKSPLCARGKLFSRQGQCGCSIFCPWDGGKQPAVLLQPPLLDTNNPHSGCRVCTGDLYHLPLLHLGSKLKNANGNVSKFLSVCQRRYKEMQWLSQMHFFVRYLWARMHFESIPGNTVHHLQHSIQEYCHLAMGLIFWVMTNFKPIWINKLDRRQKSHLEGNSNESHLGQAMQKEQKVPLCKNNAFQEMRKPPTLLLQGSQTCPKQHREASHLFPPTSPGASPAATVLISLPAPWNSSGILLHLQLSTHFTTPSHPSPTPRQINPS